MDILVDAFVADVRLPSHFHPATYLFGDRFLRKSLLLQRVDLTPLLIPLMLAHVDSRPGALIVFSNRRHQIVNFSAFQG